MLFDKNGKATVRFMRIVTIVLIVVFSALCIVSALTLWTFIDIVRQLGQW